MSRPGRPERTPLGTPGLNPKREAQRAARAKREHRRQLDQMRRGQVPGVRRFK